ncbi:signal peptidase II [Chloroflexota bacterium]
MQRVESLQDKFLNVLFFLIALLVVVADQLSKAWIRANLAGGESLPAEGLFRLTRVHNSGAAFGLFQGQSFSLTIIALIGIIVVPLFALVFYRRFPFLDSRFVKPVFGLILGGTAGNLIDRLRLGHVTDFIDIGIWPAFNIADSAIVIGVIIFAYLLVFTRAKK